MLSRPTLLTRAKMWIEKIIEFIETSTGGGGELNQNWLISGLFIKKYRFDGHIHGFFFKLALGSI